MQETRAGEAAGSAAGRVADAAHNNWADRLSPPWLLPYVRLARFDRPAGAWLLLFPCWWSMLLAQDALGQGVPRLWYMLLFAIGAFVMRGAGCAYNDIVDADFDARVARTASRPIPSGQVTKRQALAFAAGLCLAGFLVLIQFNWTTVLVGIASLGMVALYPFAKRYTNWPQLVLGLTFKWGALVGWTAITGSLGWPMLALYAGCIAWTIAYDTIYAHQDKEDDALIGLKSTALHFGAATPVWLVGFFAAAIGLWVLAGALAGAAAGFYLGLALTAAHFAWQVATLDIDDPANCLARFKANMHVGWLLTAGLAADLVLGGSL
ncbi:MAG: 4-hydroxybenzoate octaprenyltransferase [Hyphomicrobiaceae bacterium]|nr:4-hydroxybenzoate octaprenyltransferase [Hyphomicrobiaceae bacterium]